LWASAASAWWADDYAYRKQIVIDPAALALTPAGGLKSPVVLVRLHEGVFSFADANADGSDIHFVAEDDKTPLSYHLEKFDPVFNLGFAWVTLPELKSGAPVKLWMYYGNANATALPPSRESYTPEQLLVYHFSDAAGAGAQDAGSYGLNSTST